jgi:hypothetical protein
MSLPSAESCAACPRAVSRSLLMLPLDAMTSRVRYREGRWWNPARVALDRLFVYRHRKKKRQRAFIVWISHTTPDDPVRLEPEAGFRAETCIQRGWHTDRDRQANAHVRDGVNCTSRSFQEHLEYCSLTGLLHSLSCQKGRNTAIAIYWLALGSTPAKFHLMFKSTR